MVARRAPDDPHDEEQGDREQECSAEAEDPHASERCSTHAGGVACEDRAVSVARHLASALAASDLDAARAELVRAWVAMPCERLSRLVELADAKLDAVLPYQLANLGSVAAAKAPAVLAGIPPDPRVVHELLDLFARPPWRSNPALPFWRLACERIVATRDPRVLARLEEVALAYPARIPTTVGFKVAAYLNKAALALRAAIDAMPALDEDAARACEVLEAKLGAPPPMTRSRGVAVAHELLAAVYAAPGDDGPREVLADHLLQRGDPYGEFLSLQLARSHGRADDATRARELALLATSNGVWAGRIGMAIEAGHFAYHRGFVAYAQLPRTKQTLAQFQSEPAWNTVEIFDVTWSITVKADRDALTEILRASPGVRAVLGVPTSYLAALDPATLAKLERIEVEIGEPEDTVLVHRWLATAHRPRTLAIRHRPATSGPSRIEDLERAAVERILEAPQLSRLGKLVVCTHVPQTWLARLEATRLPVIAFAMSVLHVELAREGGGYPRAVARQIHGAGYPEALLRHFAQTLHGRAFVVDARVPFYPGMTLRPTQAKPWPLLEGVVDDITLLGR